MTSPFPTLPTSPLRLPCGPAQMPLLEISKDRPSVVRCREVHSRIDIAAAASGCAEPPHIHVPPLRFPTVLTAFAFSTLRLFSRRCQPWGCRCFVSPYGVTPHQRVLPFEVFSPSLAVPLVLPCCQVRPKQTGASSPPCRQGVHRAPCLLTLRSPSPAPSLGPSRLRGSLKAFLQVRARSPDPCCQ